MSRYTVIRIRERHVNNGLDDALNHRRHTQTRARAVDGEQEAHLIVIAYPLLRVESKEVEGESVRGLPPGLLRPASIEPLDLDRDGYLSALWTAKAADLAQLALQLTIDALQQRGSTNDFACHSLQ